MDGRQSLGIALDDTGLSAVLLQASGRSHTVVATAALPLASPEMRADIAGALNRLCADLNWQPSSLLVLGLPLTMLSVHNLRLPFQETRQQAQAFPFEMEERLLRPAEQVESVYHCITSGTGGSELLAFAVDKTLLQSLLPEAGKDGRRQWIFDPDSICPSVYALAQQAIAAAPRRPSFMLLHAELHTASIALVQAGTVQACRRLSVLFADENPDIPEMQVIRQRAEALAGAIRQSLALFRQHQETGAMGVDRISPALPAHLFVCGPLAHAEELQTRLAELLQVTVERLHGQVSGGSVSQRQLLPAFDAALACALCALQPGKAGVSSVNFRRGTFAKRGGRLWQSKNAKVAAALALAACTALFVFFAGEVRSLKLKSEQLRQEMTQVFRSAFPQVQVVRDPYLEMQAALRSGAGTGAPLLFSPGRESVLSLLADISSRIPEEIALTINRFSLDQDLLLLRGQTSSFKDVDQIRTLLAASPLFSEVRILSSTAEKSGQENLIRFELRLKRRLAGSSQ